MDKDLNKTTKAALLERMLDTYGSDTARWPEDVARRLDRFMASDGEARARMARERAFEQALNTAAQPDRLELSMLSERIVAEVALSMRGEAAGSGEGEVGRGERRGQIIPWPVRERRAPSGTQPERWRLNRRPGDIGSAAALLAASLVVGIFVGTTDIVRPIAQDFADTIGIAAEIDPDDAIVIDETPEVSEWEAQ